MDSLCAVPESRWLRTGRGAEGAQRLADVAGDTQGLGMCPAGPGEPPAGLEPRGDLVTLCREWGLFVGRRPVVLGLEPL